MNLAKTAKQLDVNMYNLKEWLKKHKEKYGPIHKEQKQTTSPQKKKTIKTPQNIPQKTTQVTNNSEKGKSKNPQKTTALAQPEISAQMSAQEVTKKSEVNTPDLKKGSHQKHKEKNEATPRRRQQASITSSQESKNATKTSKAQSMSDQQLFDLTVKKLNDLDRDEEETQTISISPSTKNHKRKSQSKSEEEEGIGYIHSEYSKEKAIKAVLYGVLTLDEAVEEFIMNREQLSLWVRMRKYSKPGYGATSKQQ